MAQVLTLLQKLNPTSNITPQNSSSMASIRKLNPKYTVDNKFLSALDSLKLEELKAVGRMIKVSTTGRKDKVRQNIKEYFVQLCSLYSRGEVEESNVKSAFDSFEQIVPLSNFDNEPITVRAVPRIVPAKPSENMENGDGNMDALYIWDNTLLENPFFLKEKFLIVTRIRSLRDNKNKPMNLNFNLMPSQRTKEYAVQIYCFSLSSNDGKHTWPANTQFDIALNGVDVRLTRGNNNPIGNGKKATKDQMVDITQQCRLGSNRIDVSSGAYGPYALVVILMKRQSIELLINNIKGNSTLSYEAAFTAVKQKFQRQVDGLQEISSKISLLCPLSKKMIDLPARATSCGHLQCFDLTTFLMMMERTPKWKCPYCNKPILYKNIIVDIYFQKILSSVSKETTEVEIKPDANWEIPKVTIVPEPKKRKVEGPKVTAIDVDDIPAPKAPKLSDVNTVNDKNVEIETIADSLESLRKSQSPGSPEKQEHPPSKGCYLCKKQNTKRCSRCKSISYCGKECQLLDWDRHKQECKLESEARVEGDAQRTPVPVSAPPTPKTPGGASVVDAIVIDDD